MNTINQNQKDFFQHLFHRDPFDNELERVLNNVSSLPKTYREVLTARFGLDGSDPKDLLEVSTQLGLGREKVRQIQEKAIGKLLFILSLSSPGVKAILPEKLQGEWVVIQGGMRSSFASFEDAVAEFRSRIQEHMRQFDECYVSGLPFSIGAFFFGREENGSSTDEDLAVYHRINRLMSCLTGGSMSFSTSASLNALGPENNPIVYSEPDELTDNVETCSVDVHEKDGEIRVRLEKGEGDDTIHLYTNALSFVNPDIEYYFDAHLLVVVGKRERLGLPADLRLRLIKA